MEIFENTSQLNRSRGEQTRDEPADGLHYTLTRNTVVYGQLRVSARRAFRRRSRLIYRDILYCERSWGFFVFTMTFIRLFFLLETLYGTFLV